MGTKTAGNFEQVSAERGLVGIEVWERSSNIEPEMGRGFPAGPLSTVGDVFFGTVKGGFMSRMPNQVLERRRRPEYPVNEIFLNRWSPRAMSGEPIAENELMSLFEAAKWAPSSFNSQSWRFIYARRGTPSWPVFLGLLEDHNRQWAQQGAALIVAISKTLQDRTGQPVRTHSFDTGAAWENLALQGSFQGLVIHGMEGFDYEKAKELLGVPEGYMVEAMIVVGRPGRREDLSPSLQEREYPSMRRKKLGEFVFEGKFGRT